LVWVWRSHLPNPYLAKLINLMLGTITCCDFAVKQPNQASKKSTQAVQKAIAIGQE